ncbi:hypothetical protein DICPUDRAFT_77298 [Dictyostelium purpureum]|uniref:Malonyl-CoA:ACP transacylase (MAT) domain-containing protein n=1 Tax=Dictyostelium purpureum TaxID=5786 RepID=F0ZG74_DICPU|nr:uncharacterized protein DICPUDRAFT_77298 [Dictyostelium purpureum]EGC37071.1 hypothetical protein DICPUDRAFT_77298 [Dictyostelium purpureum]|eukprot:XP_003286428.1 hypothetical protein DICPUDRAFT_77298 [Dictyostelium purpureum]
MDSNYLIYLFCGQKVIWDKRNFYLYENDEFFKNKMNFLNEKIKEKYGFSTIERVYQYAEKNEILNDQILVHLMLLIFQITLFEFLTQKHKPNLIVGISCGEIPALYCSGIVDLDTSIDLSYKRGYYLNQTLSFGGSMVYIESNDATLREKIGDLGPVVQAGINSPNTCFYGGKEEAIDEFIVKLNQANFYNKKFFLKGCFHSPHMESIKKDILDIGFESKQPSIPFISVSNNKMLSGSIQEDLYNSNSLYENIRNTVQTSFTFQRIFTDIEKSQSIKKAIIYEMCPFSSNNDYITDILQSVEGNKLSMDQTLFCLPSKPIIDTNFLFDELQMLLN